jgi:uncharacterized protein
VIAVDTNVLVAASRDDAPGHALARPAIARLAESPDPWAIPWPCVHEFLAVVTHPRIFDPPTSLELALDHVDAWVESPSLVVLAETANYWPQLRTVLVASQVIGPRVHDARIAALCLVHGIEELWTQDRDFSRFPSLKTRNPLAA